MNSRSQSRRFVGADVTRYTATLRRDGGLRAAFMNYEAFDRDAAFAASMSDASEALDRPTLAIACQSPLGNTLQRQLAGSRARRT